MTPFTLTSFMYDGLPLDLSGRYDDEDCWVERVSVAGSKHDIHELLADGVIDRLSKLAPAQIAINAAEEAAEAALSQIMADRRCETH